MCQYINKIVVWMFINILNVMSLQNNIYSLIPILFHILF